MRVTPALEPEHGSTVLTRGGLLGLVIGIPRPPQLIPIIPKYILCRESPWSRAGSSFCRVLEAYGPHGVSKAILRASVRELYDPLYGHTTPYVSVYDALDIVTPREALWRVVAGPRNRLHYTLLDLLQLLEARGVSVENVGVTGSLAAGIENLEISDIDLVVYGVEASESMYKIFVEEIGLRGPPIPSFGGLRVEPGVSIGWRRGLFKGLIVGWVGLPGVGELCEPLREYFKVRAPAKPVSLTLEIPKGQPQALTYPPCVRSRDGVYIVSFEYNVGALLYRGGEIRVEGLASWDGGVVYIATREKPGLVRSSEPHLNI